MDTGHKIKQSLKTETPSRIVFFDSESYVKHKITQEDIDKIMNGEKVTKEHTPYLICATYCRKNKKLTSYNEISDDFTGENTCENFWQSVDSFTKTKTRTYVIAHNAKYDVQVTGGIEHLVNRGYRVTSFSDSNPYFVTLSKKQCPECGSYHLNQDEDFYECVDCDLRFHYKHAVGRTLQILSSTNFYATSLEKLGKAFGHKKGSIEHSNDTPLEESIIYCRQDVNILKVAMLGFIEFIQAENLGNFKMTIAGQSFNAYRHRFMNEPILVHRKPLELKTERAAYAGGRTEAWRLGSIPGKVPVLDVNSMYPAVMLENKFPVELISYRKKLKIIELQDFINRGYLICARVEICTKQRYYFQKSNKLIFPIGTFETTLTTPELIHALENKHIVKVFDTCIYRGANIFSDFITYFYTKRLEAKDNKNEVLSLLYKLIMNSLYGKFGQKAIHWELIGTAPVDVIEVETIFDHVTRQRVQRKTFGGGIFEKARLSDGESEAQDSFPAIAAHVTAYARCLLWSCIEIAGEKNTYYMDTDSIFCNEKGYKNLVDAGMVDPDTLGKLKLEYVCWDVEIRGCKDYSITYFSEKDNKEVTVNKIKGVSGSSVKVKENVYISTVWGGMSGYIKDGKMSGFHNTLMKKVLKREYNKGVVDENKIVQPFNLAKEN